MPPAGGGKEQKVFFAEGSERGAQVKICTECEGEYFCGRGRLPSERVFFSFRFGLVLI